MPETTYGWQHVADGVRERRLELGLSQRAAAAKGGVSTSTWVSLEAHAQAITDLTAAGIAKALGWPSSSIKYLLNGSMTVEELTRAGERLAELNRARDDMADAATRGTDGRQPVYVDESEIDFNSAITHVPDHIRRTIEDLVRPYLQEDERPAG